MRDIFDHHDGHGLAESIQLAADERDPNAGGASHRYIALINGTKVLEVQFQQGPRGEAYSTPGVIDSVLLAIVADRMKGFQAGPFATRENALVLTKVEEAMHWLKHRADERARRGVLGRNEK